MGTIGDDSAQATQMESSGKASIPPIPPADEERTLPNGASIDTLVLERAPRIEFPAPTGPSLGSTGALPPEESTAEDGILLTPADGSLIGGIYRVDGRLGEGAMGVILLAKDEQLERPVAIKLLRSEQMDHPSMQSRLLDEARAMAKVHHPNVVEIYAFGEHHGGMSGRDSWPPASLHGSAPYFVMEYVDGPTVDAYVRGRGGPPLPLDEALHLLDQMCLGVTAIHEAGIVHRDIKPSNILVGPGRRVVVADLGLAKKVSPDDQNRPTFSGTPAYIAPEVALRRTVDRAFLPRVDVYALGLIAYWLLVGRLPFEGRNLIELFKQHAYRAPPPPSELNPTLPPSFDAPLLAALAKEPEERTATAEELRFALLKAREDAPLSWMPMRVIVADDSPDFRSLVAMVLEAALPRAEVISVPDGQAALEVIQEKPPALAVVDLDMPGMDGIALTEAVRALPTGGDFPIIVATGSGGAAEWQRLSRLGASAFLVKPFDAGQLVTLARGLLGDLAEALSKR
ncbi:Serine/threonine kinase [Chondromyces apiculatus DSM 436]|uniref:Serine/threonine kinase n=1 Tax=Chondromyces apiculatus DSM 436 TaxID=1192034 RepID=A0A017T6Y7_9BACT|nr:Serine/threonine kinase [Chondromyces apiculatus DSM 436]